MTGLTSRGTNALDIDAEVLGRRIRTARIAAGLTQRELSGEYASTAFISRIESGRRSPSFRVLREIATRLGVEVDELRRVGQADLSEKLRYGLSRAARLRDEGAFDAAIGEARQVAVDAAAAGVVHASLEAAILCAEVHLVEDRPLLADATLEDLAAKSMDAAETVRVSTLLCRADLALGHADAALEHADTGWGIVEERHLDGLPDTIELALAHADVLLAIGDLHRATEVMHAALAGADRLGSETGLAQAYWHASESSASAGHHLDAFQFAQHALAQDAVHKHRARVEELRGRIQDLELRPDISPAGDRTR